MPQRTAGNGGAKLSGLCAWGCLGRASSRILGDHGSRFFADHDRWRVGAGIQRRRHDRGVGNAQPLYPNNTQPRIDDGGRILLRSNDPSAHPPIFPEYISEPEDLRALARPVRRMRDMMRKPSIRDLIEVE